MRRAFLETRKSKISGQSRTNVLDENLNKKEEKKKWNNAGIGHIEAIISAVIFITFVFILFYIINPFSTTSQTNTADLLLKTFPQELKAELQRVSLQLDETPQGGACFKIEPPLNITTKAFDSSGGVTDADLRNNKLSIRGSSGFYTLYFSNSFTTLATPLNGCPTVNNYRLGIITKVDAVSHEEILDFNQTYWNEYSLSKEELRLGESSDYGIIIFDSLGQEVVNMLRPPRTALNINVDEKPYLMSYRNGTLQNIKIRIYTY